MKVSGDLAMPDTRLQDSSGTRPWMLVLDDDPGTRMLYTELLTHHRGLGTSYDVVSAETYGEAVAALQEHREAPTVAVIDRWLPDGDGQVLAERLGERMPAAHIIVVTADDGVEVALRSWSLGATHLVKPVSTAVFVRHVERAIEAPA